MINQTFGKLYKRHFRTNKRLERIWKVAQVDFKKRYYNDRLGLLWALINPLTQIGLYYFIFTRVLNRGEENFALYLFSGLIIWIAFSHATSLGLKVLSNKYHLIESVQFNWIDLYTSHMISVSIGLFFNLVAYFILLLLMGVSVGEHFYLFPVILISWFFTTAGATIILGLIKPIFEDILHIWSLLIMIGLWVSGIFFSGSFYFDNYPWFSYINPFIGILLNTRACLLEGNVLVPSLLYYNLAFGIVIYVFAIWLFKRFAKKVLEQL